MNNKRTNNLKGKGSHYINLGKASPEAINAILTALNTEVDEALRQKRIPLLDNAFRLLGPIEVHR